MSATPDTDHRTTSLKSLEMVWGTAEKMQQVRVCPNVRDVPETATSSSQVHVKLFARSPSLWLRLRNQGGIYGEACRGREEHHTQLISSTQLLHNTTVLSASSSHSLPPHPLSSQHTITSFSKLNQPPQSKSKCSSPPSSLPPLLSLSAWLPLARSQS